MSGIEVAGLVLGAIPTLVRTLDIFDSIIGGTSKYKEEIVSALTLIRVQSHTTRTAIEVLLFDTLSREEFRRLLQEPNSTQWSPEIDMALKRSLGEVGYCQVLDIMTCLSKTVLDLQAAMAGIAPENVYRSRSIRLQLRWLRNRNQILTRMEEVTKLNLLLRQLVSLHVDMRVLRVIPTLDNVQIAMDDLRRNLVDPNMMIEEAATNEPADSNDHEDASSILTEVCISLHDFPLGRG